MASQRLQQHPEDPQMLKLEQIPALRGKVDTVSPKPRLLNKEDMLTRESPCSAMECPEYADHALGEGLMPGVFGQYKRNSV